MRKKERLETQNKIWTKILQAILNICISQEFHLSQFLHDDHSQMCSSSSLTSCMCSAMRHPATFLSLEIKRKVLVFEGHLVSTCWKPRSLSTISRISSTWGTDYCTSKNQYANAGMINIGAYLRIQSKWDLSTFFFFFSKAGQTWSIGVTFTNASWKTEIPGFKFQENITS